MRGAAPRALLAAALLAALPRAALAQGLTFFQFNVDTSVHVENCTATGRPEPPRLLWNFVPKATGMQTGMLVENNTGRCLTGAPPARPPPFINVRTCEQ